MKKYLKCIDDSRPPAAKHFKQWITEGSIYTIRRTSTSLTGAVGVYLNEIHNPSVFIPEFGGNVEPNFNINRFAYVDELGLEIHEEETEKLVA